MVGARMDSCTRIGSILVYEILEGDPGGRRRRERTCSTWLQELADFEEESTTEKKRGRTEIREAI